VNREDVDQGDVAFVGKLLHARVVC
jgi:hypothetical protein